VERDARKYLSPILSLSPIHRASFGRDWYETLSNWSQAIPTVELSRKTVVTAKEQNLWAIESFADQRVEK
jgi:hypothetical protein